MSKGNGSDKKGQSTHPNATNKLVKESDKFKPIAKKETGKLSGRISASTSKKTGDQKLWMEKDTYDNDLLYAVNEVLASEIAIKLFGSNNAPKTAMKFGAASKSKEATVTVVSRMKHADCMNLEDLLKDKDILQERLNAHPLTGFGTALALKILLGDGDINLGGFVTHWSKKTKDQHYPLTAKDNEVYGVDLEKAFTLQRKNVFKILESPQLMVAEIGEMQLSKGKQSRAALENAINPAEVRELVTQFASLSNEDILAISVRLNNQLKDKGKPEALEFIQGRTAQLIDIRDSCQTYVKQKSTEASKKKPHHSDKVSKILEEGPNSVSPDDITKSKKNNNKNRGCTIF